MCWLRFQVGIKAILPLVAAVAFSVYLVWNALWLARGHLPPSIWVFFTGLPCPTTGMCRSLHALCCGQFRTSLLYHPLTIPYLALLALSGLVIGRQIITRAELRLPRAVAQLWFAAIGLGLILKLLLGRAYW